MSTTAIAFPADLPADPDAATAAEAPPASARSRSLEARKRRETLIAHAVATGGPDALHDVAPVAFTANLQSGRDATDPSTLLDACVYVDPAVNPLFDAILTQLGASRRSNRTYMLGVGKDADPRVLRALLDLLPLGIVFSQKAAEESPDGRFESIDRDADAALLAARLCASAAGERLDPATVEERFASAPYPTEGPLAGQAITLAHATGKLFIKLCTNPTEYSADARGHVLSLHAGCGDANVWTPEDTRTVKPVTADVAIAALEAARAAGFRVTDEHGIGRALRANVTASVSFQRVPGAPGLTRVVLGADVPRIRGVRRTDLDPVGPSSDTRAAVMTCDEAADLLATIERRAEVPYAVDAHVADVIAMTDAEPSTIEGLQPDQARVVGVKLATKIGFLNASPTGAGKTVMELCAFLEQADLQPGWRGVAVMKAALRAQWESEAERFFPECQVRSFVGADMANLPEFFEQAADAPALALLSYDAVREYKDVLLELPGVIHDMTVDEAKVLGNPSSARAQAIWLVRETKALRATAMTATPVDRSLDELAAIVGFARNDRELASRKFSREFDLSTTAGQIELQRTLGPTMAIAEPEGIPPVRTTPVSLTGHPAELALVDGAAKHLRRIFNELAERTEAAAALDPDDPDLADIKGELARVRGAILGGITLARMASVDPEAVWRSKSVGRELLHAEGLLEPALAVGGTKRREAVEFARMQAGRGHATLLFTDFTSIADGLITDLTAAGVTCAAFTGKLTDAKRRAVQRSFQGFPCRKHRLVGIQYTCGACELPSVDVAVLTEAACEGLNFQRADAVYHVDPPWVPSRFVQRVGRAPRIGSTAEVVENIVPVLKDTPEAKIVGRMIRRAAELMAALYGGKGKDLSTTAVGQAVAGLTDVAEVEKAADEGFFDFLRASLPH